MYLLVVNLALLMTCGALCWCQSLMRSHASSCSGMWRTREVKGEREKELYSGELLFQLFIVTRAAVILVQTIAFVVTARGR